MVINLSKEHSLVNTWIAELRDMDIQSDRMRFRRNLERIGEVAAYEISKKMNRLQRSRHRELIHKIEPAEMYRKFNQHRH